MDKTIKEIRLEKRSLILTKGSEGMTKKQAKEIWIIEEACARFKMAMQAKMINQYVKGFRGWDKKVLRKRMKRITKSMIFGIVVGLGVGLTVTHCFCLTASAAGFGGFLFGMLFTMIGMVIFNERG